MLTALILAAVPQFFMAPAASFGVGPRAVPLVDCPPELFNCGQALCTWELDTTCWTTPSEITKCEVIVEVKCGNRVFTTIAQRLCTETTPVSVSGLGSCNPTVTPSTGWGGVSDCDTDVTFSS